MRTTNGVLEEINDLEKQYQVLKNMATKMESNINVAFYMKETFNVSAEEMNAFARQTLIRQQMLKNEVGGDTSRCIRGEDIRCEKGKRK